MIHVFIINTSAGRWKLAQNLREHLAKRGDIEYFVFNTYHSSGETDMVRRLLTYFEEERIRLYCCGGSGTMRNILNAIDDFDRIELAFFPCGLTNDFLKVFGSRKKYFEDIDNLIEGRSINVDYIKTNYGLALNSVSVGIDSNQILAMKKCKDYDVFGTSVPYILSTIWGIIGAKGRKLTVTVDKQEIASNIAEAIVMNGNTLGGNIHIANSADVDDGIFDFCVCEEKLRIELLSVFMAMVSEDYNKLKKLTRVGAGHVMEIKAPDNSRISMNLDGELIQGEDYWRIEVVRGGLKFVMPKGTMML